jgi:hypothetical protein
VALKRAVWFLSFSVQCSCWSWPIFFLSPSRRPPLQAICITKINACICKLAFVKFCTDEREYILIYESKGFDRDYGVRFCFQWRAFVNVVMNIWVPWKAGSLLPSEMSTDLMRSLFWDVVWHRLLVAYWRFGSTYPSDLQGSSSVRRRVVLHVVKAHFENENEGIRSN